MNGYDAARCSPFSSLNRISYVRLARISYTLRVFNVTAKVTHSAENAKHLAIRVLLPFGFVAKFLKTKFFSKSRTPGFGTLFVVTWG